MFHSSCLQSGRDLFSQSPGWPCLILCDSSVAMSHSASLQCGHVSFCHSPVWPCLILPVSTAAMPHSSSLQCGYISFFQSPVRPCLILPVSSVAMSLSSSLQCCYVSFCQSSVWLFSFCQCPLAGAQGVAWRGNVRHSAECVLEANLLSGVRAVCLGEVAAVVQPR